MWEPHLADKPSALYAATTNTPPNGTCTLTGWRTVLLRQRLQLLHDVLVPLVEDVHVRLEHADVRPHLWRNAHPPSAPVTPVSASQDRQLQFRLLMSVKNQDPAVAQTIWLIGPVV